MVQLADREILKTPAAQALLGPKTPRVIVNVKRGPTDTIGKVVFRHEIPLLEEIHGEGNVAVITDTDPDGRKLMRSALKGKGPVISVEEFPEDDLGADATVIMKHFDPADDPREEYNRMELVYGRHAEKPMSVVEAVYGRFQEGRFTAAVRGDMVRGKPQLTAADIEAMKGPEIQERLVELRVEYAPQSTLKQLRVSLKGVLGID